MEKRGVIDRFEGNIAVIEIDGETVDVDKALLPKKVRVGDAIIIGEDGIYHVDMEATKKLRKEIDVLMDELFE
ncbi:hypothetical protein PghCCS26_62590 [Paenibacillus glycanilyticus]|uniref:DUF3006 domain-containing protein n=1 Tax=Paenibacillus glycanilyticus TaxID=126569 RepID=A0ABQ6NX66_9BACL|nr:DUF3006 domain-containing protein [Paenibacillus glycanilyticus]GMK49129.1 hypothetical protein PghCCS26_62590 [Paenibacillus glycanilyticus]